jgi:hypothetical protein
MVSLDQLWQPIQSAVESYGGQNLDICVRQLLLRTRRKIDICAFLGLRVTSVVRSGTGEPVLAFPSVPAVLAARMATGKVHFCCCLSVIETDPRLLTIQSFPFLQTAKSTSTSTSTSTSSLRIRVASPLPSS